MSRLARLAESQLRAIVEQKQDVLMCTCGHRTHGALHNGFGGLLPNRGACALGTCDCKYFTPRFKAAS